MIGKLTKLFESRSNDSWQIVLCFYLKLGDGQSQVFENNSRKKRQILGKNDPLSHTSQFEKTGVMLPRLMNGDYEAIYLLYFISLYILHVNSQHLSKSNNNLPQILPNTSSVC